MSLAFDQRDHGRTGGHGDHDHDGAQDQQAARNPPWRHAGCTQGQQFAVIGERAESQHRAKQGGDRQQIDNAGGQGEDHDGDSVGRGEAADTDVIEFLGQGQKAEQHQQQHQHRTGGFQEVECDVAIDQRHGAQCKGCPRQRAGAHSGAVRLMLCARTASSSRSRASWQPIVPAPTRYLAAIGARPRCG